LCGGRLGRRRVLGRWFRLSPSARDERTSDELKEVHVPVHFDGGQASCCSQPFRMSSSQSYQPRSQLVAHLVKAPSSMTVCGVRPTVDVSQPLVSFSSQSSQPGWQIIAQLGSPNALEGPYVACARGESALQSGGGACLHASASRNVTRLDFAQLVAIVTQSHLPA
jgi:hypothetical protein